MKMYIKAVFDNVYKQYLFNCNEDLYLERLDKVVVDTVNGLKIATVVAIYTEKEISFDGNPTRWVVDRIDERKINRAQTNAEILKVKSDIGTLTGRLEDLQEKLNEHSLED